MNNKMNTTTSLEINNTPNFQTSTSQSISTTTTTISSSPSPKSVIPPQVLKSSLNPNPSPYSPPRAPGSK